MTVTPNTPKYTEGWVYGPFSSRLNVDMDGAEGVIVDNGIGDDGAPTCIVYITAAFEISERQMETFTVSSEPRMPTASTSDGGSTERHQPHEVRRTP